MNPSYVRLRRSLEDAITRYGEFVRVDRGLLVRSFLQDEQDPSADVDLGKLPKKPASP